MTGKFATAAHYAALILAMLVAFAAGYRPHWTSARGPRRGPDRERRTTVTTTLKTGDGQLCPVDTLTIRDVKPRDCGMRDESWYVARHRDGMWVALSDFASQDPAYFASEAEAEQYWADAAEAERSTRA